MKKIIYMFLMIVTLNSCTNIAPTATALPSDTQISTSTDTPTPTDTTTLLPQFTKTAVPSLTATKALAATKTVTRMPTPINIAAFTVTPNLTPIVTGSGMWLSQAEIMSLSVTSTAWDKLLAAANGGWGQPNITDQNNKHDLGVLAGALVCARIGNENLCGKVRDGIMSAKHTFDDASEWGKTNGVLASGRQIAAYVISADLINLSQFDPSADAEFRTWLTIIRKQKVGTQNRWTSLTGTSENAAENWAAHALASRIAASIYLGDVADVNRSALILRAWSDRSFYPKDGIGVNGYFQHSSSYKSSWICGTESVYTAINNSPCDKNGVNLDGALVEDASRGGSCCQLSGAGYSYSWEVLQGLTLSTELLYRTNRFDNPYLWGNSALKRAADHMERQGWVINNPGKFVPWLLNMRYGTSYPTASNSDGRYMSWGDWQFQR